MQWHYGLPSVAIAILRSEWPANRSSAVVPRNTLTESELRTATFAERRLEPPTGFEPVTPSLPWRCSTTELGRRTYMPAESTRCPTRSPPHSALIFTVSANVSSGIPWCVRIAFCTACRPIRAHCSLRGPIGIPSNAQISSCFIATAVSVCIPSRRSLRSDMAAWLMAHPVPSHLISRMHAFSICRWTVMASPQLQFFSSCVMFAFRNFPVLRGLR